MAEYLDIVDINGNPTGLVEERRKVHIEGLMHRTSHVWILRHNMNTGKLQILLQLRAYDKSAFPGCYDISSAGHIQSGQDFEESAIRELEEELGVSVGVGDLIPVGHRLVFWDDLFDGIEFHDRQYSNVYILWLNLDEDNFKLQEEEVAAVKWMDFDVCYNGVINNEFKNCIVLEELDMVRAGAVL